MKTVVHNLLEQLRQRTPPTTVLLVPGDCFYGQRFELPEDLSESDLAAFAELSLEGVSPFPLEQLAWGFLHEPGQRHIYAYAVPHVRLRREGFEEIGSHFQVFPSFITRFGNRYKKRTITFLAEVDTLSAICFESDNPVPERIVSRRLQVEDPSDGDFLQMRANMLEQLAAEGDAIEDGLWIGTGRQVEGDALCFEHRWVGGGEQTVSRHHLSYTSTTVWQADLRDADFGRRQRRQRLQARRIWSGMVAAACFTGILLILQGGLFGFRQWNENRLARYERQMDPVTRIEENHTLLTRIESFAQQELKPFAMLEVLNRERPPTIYFSRTQARNWNQLEVEGQGNSVDEVNRYADRIRALGSVSDVEVRSIRSRANVAPFSIVFTFDDLPHLDWPPAGGRAAAAGRGDDEEDPPS